MRNNPDIYLYERIEHKNADFNVWMAFPGPESFALSSLGFLWMYKSIDECFDVNVEMLCLDTKTTKIRKENLDMMGFSFCFDMDFYNIFTMIEKYDYPLRSKDRGEGHPLIFAGGPVVTANPEPYREFFDFFILGDGEDLNYTAIQICKENKGKSKKEILEILARIEGIYVPNFRHDKVVKITKKLTECIYTPIISERSFFKNTFIIEVERGCANRCGFCLASYLNLPIRFVPYDEIITKLEKGLKYTNKIALLGAQITAHPHFKDICLYISNKIKNGQQINMSISSMRVDAFCPEIVEALVLAGQKNTTLAIEAGSERLRKLINKNLTEEQIFEAIEIASKNGLKGFKFYGMIGLPTETQADIDELITLAKKIKKRYKRFDISFGFSSFVPKANTPFQWVGRENTKLLEKKAEYLKKELHKIGIHAQFASIKWDYYQAVLSRGDSGLSEYLVDIYKNQAKIGAFKKFAKIHNINTDYYALSTFAYQDVLPWDFIEFTPGKDFLISENKRLLGA